MRFTQSYAACCVCSPTRGSIMTGKYPPSFGITDFIPGRRSEKMRSAPHASHLPLAEITIAEALHAGGYSTFFAGKWHLGGGQFYPGAQGFPQALDESAQLWYPKSKTPPPHKNDDPKTTDRIVNEAVAFIDAHTQTPVYAYPPFLAVHTPIGARGDLLAKYEKKKMSAPPDAWGQERARPVRLVQNNALYAAMLEQLDTGIARILAALEKNGLTEKTIVVFMSDNGGLATSEGHPTANPPLRAGKGWPYEGGIRVPWIVCAPRHHSTRQHLPNPRHQHRLLSHAARTRPAPLAPRPASRRHQPRPTTSGRPPRTRRTALLAPPALRQSGRRAPCIIRAGDWKLIEWYENGALELYHIPADHREKNNLAAREPARTKSLQTALARWRQSVGAIMPTPNPAFDPAAPASPAAEKKNRKK